MIMEGKCVNKIKVCSAMLTRCEFNNASIRMHFLFRYISLNLTPIQRHSTALTSLNSPLILYSLWVYQTQISGDRYRASGRLLFFILLNKIFHRIFINIPSQIIIKKYVTPPQSSVYIYSSVPERKKNVVSHLLQKI